MGQSIQEAEGMAGSDDDGTGTLHGQKACMILPQILTIGDMTPRSTEVPMALNALGGFLKQTSLNQYRKLLEATLSALLPRICPCPHSHSLHQQTIQAIQRCIITPMIARTAVPLSRAGLLLGGVECRLLALPVPMAHLLATYYQGPLSSPLRL